MRTAVSWLALALSTACSSANSAETERGAGACGHAHNDYENPRPLFGALESAFCSVEVDVHLVGEALLVAHHAEEIDPARTLEDLYLDPLRDLFRTGRLSRPDQRPLILLIDVKTEAEPTWNALSERLEAYGELFTRFSPEGRREGAVTAIVSGNRAFDAVESAEVRYAAIDGRIADLGSAAPADLLPLISDNWLDHFTWIGGLEPMPPDQRAKLERMVQRAHGHGRLIRFWKTGDAEEMWTELARAGVDLINTDDVAGLGRFLKRD